MIPISHWQESRSANAAPNWALPLATSLSAKSQAQYLDTEIPIPRHFEDDAVPKFSLRTGRSLHKFATLEQLRTETQCSFCKLALTAIETCGRKDIESSTWCSLTWEVDGRAELDSRSDDARRTYQRSQTLFNNKTRRLKLSWGNGNDEGKVYIILVVPSSHTEGKQHGTHSLGREFFDPTEKQVLLRHWLDSQACCRDHKDTCEDTHGNSDSFSQLVGETYFGVIDVLDMCLVRLPKEKDSELPKRYVALSYVWGKDLPGTRYTTTESTVMLHMKPGGLASAWPKLPKTIQDAIWLTSRLGERYLWVDSLCIVQDNQRSWAMNAKAMHLIYGHAYFTICAADGDARKGLRAVGPMLQAMHSARHPGIRIEDQPYDSDIVPISAQYAAGIRLLAVRPLDVVVNDSEWSKRAWTFQEQILSRRCLIFAEGRAYFQCRFARISEDIWTDSRGNGWSQNRTNSLLQSPKLLSSRPIWFYMEFVRLYTSRCLTKSKDILDAFEGIAWLLQDHMDHEEFLFGLPPSHFDLALLWVPTKALKRRRKFKSHSPSNGLCQRDITGQCTCNTGDRSLDEAEFPSCS
ncbi:hypothetical protein diail_9468 [Diaporthe ilicicola]|nr:hypothetical protein diail_9468 [Diaporthe ilicicola]